jgi:hypothetical protein
MFMEYIQIQLPVKQKNKYAAKPENEVRANKIREKLFNDSTNAQGN